ncbi:MAG: hypothetical protein J7J25_02620, partial [Candidatus Omnitrophica bacterium]|nr:hypothetical protein [Candidatus Omnitrophota bacterium]
HPINSIQRLHSQLFQRRTYCLGLLLLLIIIPKSCMRMLLSSWHYTDVVVNIRIISEFWRTPL